MLATNRDLMRRAREERYAVGAFNVNNLETILAVAEAAVTEKSWRLAFTASVREVLANSPKEHDPRRILGPAKEGIEEVVRAKMRLFGSSGKS